MKYPEITLRRGKEQSLQRLHPWVFSGAVAHIPDSLEEGDIVDVITCDGRKIATGHYQIGSITIRILSWEDTEINVYGDSAVLQAHSPGMHFARDIIARQLTQLPDAGIRNVYYKSETTLPYKAHLDPQNDYIIGQYSTNIAEENGLKFHVDWLKGQKTGFFVDQRDNRALLEKYAYKRKVLNMFCYTGGFSVYALRGGAAEVHSVDSSAKAITLTDANVSLNFPDDTRHTSHVEDAFKYLSSIDDSYDLIILDPPAFAKHRSALKNALIGYRKLNAKAFEKIAPGGILFTFSCSQAVSREQFRLAVFSAAAQSQRKVRILHQLTQPADHPVNIYHPEGEYLKGLILYVE